MFVFPLIYIMSFDPAPPTHAKAAVGFVFTHLFR
jgi:hypothetical protein